jgi:ADP-heptose:LPS heptosyltransferase
MKKRRMMKFIGRTYLAIYSLIMHAIDSASLLFVMRKQRESDPLKNVLIVRLDAIGDFFLWLDAAKEFRRLFPAGQFRITLLGNRIWTPLAESIPFFDEVLSLERSRFSSGSMYRYQTLKHIRRSGYDIVIQPTSSREFLLGDSVVRFSGAKERIASEGDCSNILPFLKRISDNWYTRLVHASREPLMELERNAEFLRGLGLPAFRCGISELQNIFLPSRSTGLPDYYVLFPGVGLPIKQWPVENFAGLAERIYKDTGWTGIVCGGPGEEGIGDSLLRSTDAPLENRSGRTSLQELASLIAGARLVVANDTSAIHIAAAVSTPAVCILGGGHYGRFVPYRIETPTERPLPVPVVYTMDCYYCNWDCIYYPKKDDAAPCVRNISVDAAWDTVRQILTRIAMAPTKKNGRAAE